MSKQLTITERLTEVIQSCAYVNKDPDGIGFSQLEKDTIRKDVNKLLDYVISQTEQRHIKVLLTEAINKIQNKKLDDMRKENLEKLEHED